MGTLLEMAARNALAATLLAGVVLIVSLFIKRPAVRNALWMIVLVRLLLPPVWSVPLPRVGAEVANVDRRIEASEAIVAPVDEPVFAATDILPPLGNEMEGLTDAETIGVSQPPLIGNDNPLSLVEEQSAVAPADPVPPSAFRAPTWFFWALLFLWIAGTVGILAIAIVRIRRFQRSLRDALRAPVEVQAQADRIAVRLGLKHCPNVWLVPGRVPPMLWMPGLSARRAKLIFPMELFFRLEAEQRGALIAHELAHLRRRDPWVRWLEFLTVALYWWHPLLGFIRRRLRASEEECCDAWVVSQLPERKAYATALVETVEFLSGPDRPACPELASGAGPVQNLQWRLTMIMRGKMRGKLSRFGAAAIIGVALAAFAFGPAFSQPRPEGERERRDPNVVPRSEPGERAPGGFRPPEGDAPNRKEIERAREDVEQARHDAAKAMDRLRAAEMKLMQLAGARPEAKDGPRGGSPGAPSGLPGAPGGFPGGTSGPPRGGFPGGPGGPPGLGGGPGGNPDQLQQMQMQLEEMRRMIEEIRREMRRGKGEDRPATAPRFTPPESAPPSFSPDLKGGRDPRGPGEGGERAPPPRVPRAKDTPATPVRP